MNTSIWTYAPYNNANFDYTEDNQSQLYEKNHIAESFK